MQGIFRFSLEEVEHQHEIKTPIYIINKATGSKVQCDAIWDTGATSSMIASNIVKRLNLKPVSSTVIAGVHGVQNANCYVIDAMFSIGTILPDIKVAEASDTGGFGLLVGMDIIGEGVLHIDGTSNVLTVEFELPV